MVTKVNPNGERVTEVECWVKNSSRQHLSLQLPQRVILVLFGRWKTGSLYLSRREVSDTGAKEFDPNKTIHVKYSYAESGTELKDGQLFEMSSPQYSVPEYLMNGKFSSLRLFHCQTNRQYGCHWRKQFE